MRVQVDTREKPKAIETILTQFDELGVSYAREKLDVGDYCVPSSKFVIDRKQTINELYSNICSSDHARLKKEIMRANAKGIKICFLIEDSRASCLHDLKYWRSKYAKNLSSGERLYKAIMTMLWKYKNISFQFCRPAVTGYRIAELLRENSYGED